MKQTAMVFDEPFAFPGAWFLMRKNAATDMFFVFFFALAMEKRGKILANCDMGEEKSKVMILS